MGLGASRKNIPLCQPEWKPQWSLYDPAENEYTQVIKKTSSSREPQVHNQLPTTNPLSLRSQVRDSSGNPPETTTHLLRYRRMGNTSLLPILDTPKSNKFTTKNALLSSHGSRRGRTRSSNRGLDIAIHHAHVRTPQCCHGIHNTSRHSLTPRFFLPQAGISAQLLVLLSIPVPPRSPLPSSPVNNSHTPIRALRSQS